MLETIEDLGFCEKGEGGEFVEGGNLQAPDEYLPFNTDGGGQCNHHPDNRGGMTKVIEAVRQIRGEANPEVQVPDWPDDEIPVPMAFVELSEGPKMATVIRDVEPGEVEIGMPVTVEFVPTEEEDVAIPVFVPG